MHTTISLMDEAKRIHGVSDYKLAQLLGVVSSAVKNYRSGRSHPDVLVSQKLADLIGLDREYVAICIQAERTSNAETKAFWTRVAGRLQAAALALLVVILPAAFPDDGHASTPMDKGFSAISDHAATADARYIVASIQAAARAILRHAQRMCTDLAHLFRPSHVFDACQGLS